MEQQFYLKNLIIQNFATFKNQKITFRPGFNAIIGETGSGKSLVIDALQLILGGRADKKIVRRETDFSLIEASFHCTDQKIKTYLEGEGFPLENNEIVIKRVIQKNGSSKTYINHLSCTASFLALFSRSYIDLVGQFENQKLLSESYQLYLLDHYAKQLEEVEKFQERLKELKNLVKEQEKLIQSKTLREQRLDYLNFQLQEIELLNPSSQDEQDLLKKKNRLINIEKNQKLSFQIQEIFEGNESQTGLNGQLKYMTHLFTKNPELFADQMDLLSEIEDKAQTLFGQLEAQLSLEMDEEDLEKVLDRLDLYQKLKKKFGGSVETVIQTQVDFLKERSTLEALDFNLEDLNKKISRENESLLKQAEVLHKKRVASAKKLGEELTHKVRSLKMTGATLKLETEKLETLTDSGITRAYFIAETNPGEGFYKIKDVASGGELSRILLALRQILSAYDSISIFLFDEIDTGIGGETANWIGKALSEVSQHGQVIAITHLPQIAQFSESLIVVHKDTHSEKNESRTESTVKEVIGKMIMREVKQMAQLA